MSLCKNWNILYMKFSFDEYVVSFPISTNQFWSELYFVRYWNSYTSLLLRSICLECLSILFLRWYLSLILRYVSWMKPWNRFSWFEVDFPVFKPILVVSLFFTGELRQLMLRETNKLCLLSPVILLLWGICVSPLWICWSGISLWFYHRL